MENSIRFDRHFNFSELSWFTRICYTVFVFRVQLIVISVIAWAITTTPIRDVLVIATVDKPAQIVPIVLLLSLCTAMLWATADEMRRAFLHAGGPGPALPAQIHSWLPLALALIPLLTLTATAFSLYWLQTGGVSEHLIDGRLLLGVLSIAIAGLVVLAHTWVATIPQSGSYFFSNDRGATQGNYASLAALFGLGALVSIPFFLDDLQWTQRIGAISVILWWGFAATALFTSLAMIAQLQRVPILFILFTLAMVFSAFDLNDNHEIGGQDDPRNANHVVAGERVPAMAPGTFSLVEWLESRADKDDFEQYPIFIVATEGGASRASYYTAEVLAALQDRCPAFAQHIIAISSVSGGSVGAAVFAALSADLAKNKSHGGCDLTGLQSTPFRDRSHRIFDADLLAPTLAAMLFPDALQRILPFPVRRFDRALALERTLEDSWRQSSAGCCKPNRFTEDFQSLYSDGPASAVPLLFLNTTSVGTGLARPIAPVIPIEDPINSMSGLPMVSSLPPGELVRVQDISPVETGLSLSTAAFMSARFPLISPSASIRNGSAKYRYVDGGYFENSGAWTAENLLHSLLYQQREYVGIKSMSSGQRERLARAAFFVLLIDAEDCIDSKADPETCRKAQYSTNEPSSFGELFSIARAFINARVTRSRVSQSSIARLARVVSDTCTFGYYNSVANNAASPKLEPMAINCSPGRVAEAGGTPLLPQVAVAEVRLTRKAGAVPMNWILSQGARKEVQDSVSRSANIDLKAAPVSGLITSAETNQNAFAAVLCALHLRKGVDPAQYQKCLGMAF